MKPDEVDAFREALVPVMEAMGVRTMTVGAIKVWFDTLREFPIEQIKIALAEWPRRNNKPPAPRDMWQRLNDESVERRERMAAVEKQAEKNVVQFMGATEGGRRALRMLAGMTRSMQRANPRARNTRWADTIIDRYVDGDASLSSSAFRLACEVLHKTPEDIDDLRALRGSYTDRSASA